MAASCADAGFSARQIAAEGWGFAKQLPQFMVRQARDFCELFHAGIGLAQTIQRAVETLHSLGVTCRAFPAQAVVFVRAYKHTAVFAICQINAHAL